MVLSEQAGSAMRSPVKDETGKELFTGAELYVMQLDQINSRSSLKLFLSLYCWFLTFFRTVPRSIGFLMTAFVLVNVRTHAKSEAQRQTVIVVGHVCFTDTLEKGRRVLLSKEGVNGQGSPVIPIKLTVQPLSSLTIRSSVS
jgi:hypothetical protein